MPDELLSFDEHRRRRDDNASLVRCARCGKMILATAIRCPECGVHFQGEAQYFTHASERNGEGNRLPAWFFLAAILLLVALLVAILGLP